jgi:transposase
VIQLTPQMKIFVSVESIDFRKGIDGVAQMCRIKFSEDPFSGKIFLFTNKARKAVKILVYDGQGFWLMQKRLSRGRFTWWPSSSDAPLNAQEVGVLLWNGCPERSQMQSPWKRLE